MPYLSLEDAADRVGVSPQTIRRRIKDGTLTAYRLGPRLLRIDSDDLDQLYKPTDAA